MTAQALLTLLPPSARPALASALQWLLTERLSTLGAADFPNGSLVLSKTQTPGRVWQIVTAYNGTAFIRPFGYRPAGTPETKVLLADLDRISTEAALRLPLPTDLVGKLLPADTLPGIPVVTYATYGSKLTPAIWWAGALWIPPALIAWNGVPILNAPTNVPHLLRTNLDGLNRKLEAEKIPTIPLPSLAPAVPTKPPISPVSRPADPEDTEPPIDVGGHQPDPEIADEGGTINASERIEAEQQAALDALDSLPGSAWTPGPKGYYNREIHALPVGGSLNPYGILRLNAHRLGSALVARDGQDLPIPGIPPVLVPIGAPLKAARDLDFLVTLKDRRADPIRAVRNLGRSAFLAGMPAASAQDRVFQYLLEPNMKPADWPPILDLLDAWSKGWHEENLRAPVPEENPTESPIPREPPAKWKVGDPYPWVADVIPQIERRLGVRLQTPVLGSGVNGQVFAIEGDPSRVVKVTQNQQELRGILQLRGYAPGWIPRIDAIVNLGPVNRSVDFAGDSPDGFAILREAVTPTARPNEGASAVWHGSTVPRSEVAAILKRSGGILNSFEDVRGGRFGWMPPAHDVVDYPEKRHPLQWASDAARALAYFRRKGDRRGMQRAWAEYEAWLGYDQAYNAPTPMTDALVRASGIGISGAGHAKGAFLDFGGQNIGKTAKGDTVWYDLGFVPLADPEGAVVIPDTLAPHPVPPTAAHPTSPVSTHPTSPVSTDPDPLAVSSKEYVSRPEDRVMVPVFSEETASDIRRLADKPRLWKKYVEDRYQSMGFVYGPEAARMFVMAARVYLTTGKIPEREKGIDSGVADGRYKEHATAVRAAVARGEYPWRPGSRLSWAAYLSHEDVHRSIPEAELDAASRAAWASTDPNVRGYLASTIEPDRAERAIEAAGFAALPHHAAWQGPTERTSIYRQTQEAPASLHPPKDGLHHPDFSGIEWYSHVRTIPPREDSSFGPYHDEIKVGLDGRTGLWWIEVSLGSDDGPHIEIPLAGGSAAQATQILRTLLERPPLPPGTDVAQAPIPTSNVGFPNLPEYVTVPDARVTMSLSQKSGGSLKTSLPREVNAYQPSTYGTALTRYLVTVKGWKAVTPRGAHYTWIQPPDNAAKLGSVTEKVPLPTEADFLRMAEAVSDYFREDPTRLAQKTEDHSPGGFHTVEGGKVGPAQTDHNAAAGSFKAFGIPFRWRYTKAHTETTKTTLRSWHGSEGWKEEPGQTYTTDYAEKFILYSLAGDWEASWEAGPGAPPKISIPKGGIRVTYPGAEPPQPTSTPRIPPRPSAHVDPDALLTAAAKLAFDTFGAMPNRSREEVARDAAYAVGAQMVRKGIDPVTASSWLSGPGYPLWVKAGNLNPGMDLKDVRAAIFHAYEAGLQRRAQAPEPEPDTDTDKAIDAAAQDTPRIVDGCVEVTFTDPTHGEITVKCAQKGRKDEWHNILWRGTRYGFNGSRWARSTPPPAGVLSAVRARGITVFG